MLKLILGKPFRRALWLAAIRHRTHPVHTLKVGWTVFKTIVLTLLDDEKRASEELVKERLSTCHECPIYCHALDTCGDARTIDDEPLGCHCYMPVKARIASSVCWLKAPEQFGPEYPEGWKA